MDFVLGQRASPQYSICEAISNEEAHSCVRTYSKFYSSQKYQVSMCGRGKNEQAKLLKKVKNLELQLCFKQWKARVQRNINRRRQNVEGDKVSIYN